MNNKPFTLSVSNMNFTVHSPTVSPLSLTSSSSLPVSLVGEYGAEGFSGQGPSHGGSFRGGPPSQFEDHDPGLGPGPPPGIGFTPSPESGPSGPPTTNYNNIHIPPGAHAPANTPAELPPPSGMKHRDDSSIILTDQSKLDLQMVLGWCISLIQTKTS